MAAKDWNADRWDRLEEIAQSVSEGQTIGLLVGDRILEVVVKHVIPAPQPKVHALTPE